MSLLITPKADTEPAIVFETESDVHRFGCQPIQWHCSQESWINDRTFTSISNCNIHVSLSEYSIMNWPVQYCFRNEISWLSVLHVWYELLLTIIIKMKEKGITLVLLDVLPNLPKQWFGPIFCGPQNEFFVGTETIVLPICFFFRKLSSVLN